MTSRATRSTRPGVRRACRAALVLGCVLAASTASAFSQTRCESAGFKAEAARIGAVVDPIVTAEMRASGMPGAAFVFVHGDCVVYAKGYGRPDAARETAVDVQRTVWPIASITKLVTATAAMQLVGAGKLHLDRDVYRGLERLQAPRDGYAPITLRHLLSHTAGLDELPGRQFDGRTRPDMAAFLRTRLVRYRPPGLRTAYSSYAIALTGVLLEDASGRSYADYVRSRIFEPAGMTGSRIMTIVGDERGVARPYRLTGGRAEAIPYEWYVTTPSSSAVATAADMARFIRLHLRDGRIDGRRLLPAGLAREMRRQQATIHPALPGWGLGLQLDRVNGVDIAEHGGDIGGFSSLLTLMPTKDAGFFIVNHGEGTDLRYKVKAALLDALYPGRPTEAPKPDPSMTEALRRAYAGRYRSSFSCQTCGVEAGEVFEVAVKSDGTLSVWGRRWVRLKPDLFVSDDGRRLLGFARDANGRVETMSGGSWRVANRLQQ